MTEDRTALFVRVPTALAERLGEVSRAAGRTKQDVVTDLITNGINEVASRTAERMPSDIVDLDQLSEYLHIDPSDILSKVNDGSLPGRRFGTKWRFSTAAVLAWMAGSDRITDRPTGFSRE